MADEVAVSVSTLQDDVTEEIKVLLVRRGWSQLQLAEQAGMKQAYLSRRMTGEISFGLDDIGKIADALGVRVRDLLPDEPVASAAVSTEPRVAARAGRRQRRGAAAEPNVL